MYDDEFTLIIMDVGNKKNVQSVFCDIILA